MLLTDVDRQVLASYVPVIEGLAAYLGPCYEIVLHSLEDCEHSVIGIVNGEHTGRSVGAPITDRALDMLASINEGSAPAAYFCTNRAGEPLKSSTVPIRGEGGRIVGLLCINLYLNAPLSDVLATLTPSEAAPRRGVSGELFATDVVEVVRGALEQARAEVGADAAISPSMRNKAVVEMLDARGIFRLKEAVGIVAQELGIARNTVYLHLRTCRKAGDDKGKGI